MPTSRCVARGGERRRIRTPR